MLRIEHSVACSHRIIVIRGIKMNKVLKKFIWFVGNGS